MYKEEEEAISKNYFGIIRIKIVILISVFSVAKNNC